MSPAGRIHAPRGAAGGHPPAPRRILAIQTQRIGDVLCFTPLLTALRRRFPGASLTALVAPPADQLLAGNPDLDAAVTAQLGQMAHVMFGGLTHEPAVTLASRLAAMTELERVFFSDSGSVSVEVALKMALQFQRGSGHPERTRFVSLNGAFHGETLGVSALGGMPEFRAPFEPLLFECAHLASPADGLDVALCELERELEANAARTAAIVLEPLVQGASGMRIYDKAYLVRARELADAFGFRRADQKLMKVVLPAATPGILAGLRTALGQAWMAVVASEIFGVPGLGQRMMQASNLLAADIVVIYMATMAALYSIIDTTFVAVQSRLLRWKR